LNWHDHDDDDDDHDDDDDDDDGDDGCVQLTTTVVMLLPPARLALTKEALVKEALRRHVSGMAAGQCASRGLLPGPAS
jgi:hypothetical protein